MGPTSPSGAVALATLERLASAQTEFHTLASVADSADLVSRVLEQVPGAGRAAVCFAGSRGPRGSLESGCCRVCPQRDRGPDEVAEQICPLENQPEVESFAGLAHGSEFGRILLAVESRAEFEPYRPFVNSFAHAAAMAAQNRRLAAGSRAGPNGRSRDFLQTVIDAIPEALMVINRDFSIALANRTAQAADSNPLIPRAYCYQLSHKRELPCSDEHSRCPVTAVVESKAAVSLEHSHRDAQGQETIAEVLAAPVFDEHGEVIQIVESVRDITLRKRAEEGLVAALQEKEVLLREIHHRVKNNMQVIVSLLRIHSRRFSDERIRLAFAECRERVRAMSLVHEVLYQSNNLAQIDLRAYLKKLCRSLGHSHGVSSKGVTIMGEPTSVSLGIDQGIAVGLIVAELVSNAFKHAFPAGHPGDVSVELSNLTGGQVELSVRDNGRGLPAEIDLQNSASLGLNLVVAAVTGELGGSIGVERGGGTCFRIRFKCANPFSGE